MTGIKKKVLAVLLMILLLTMGCGKESITKQETGTSLTLENNGLEVIISPIENDRIKGTITIEIRNAPANAANVMALLSPKDMPPVDDPFTAENVMGKFVNVGDTEIQLDTMTLDDGSYILGVTAAKPPEQQKEGKDPWFARVQTEVTVENKK